MRSALLVRAFVALAAAVLLGGTLLAAPATSTSAPTSTATSDRAVSQVSSRAAGCLPRCWTAIAYNTGTGRSGWTQANNWGTKLGAMRSAHNHCRVRDVNLGHRQSCVWPANRKAFAQNGCVAVAKLVRNGRIVQWTVGKAYGPKAAMRVAKRKLDGAGTRSAGYSCSPRRF